MRVAGGDWVPVELKVTAADDSRDEIELTSNFPEGRDFVTAYSAEVGVPAAGGWVDLRVTAQDAAGNTLTQEIERAFEVAPIK